MDLLSALQLKLDPAAPDVISFVGGGGKSSALFHLADAIAARGKRVITSSTTHLSASQTGLASTTVYIAGNQLPLAQIAHALAQHNHCLLMCSTLIDESSGADRSSAACTSTVKGKHTAEEHQVSSQRVKGLPPTLINELVAQSSHLGISAVLIEADGSKRLPVKAPAAYEPVVPESTSLLVSVLGLDGIGRPIHEDFMHRPELLRQLIQERRNDAQQTRPESSTRMLQPPLTRDGQLRLTPAMAAYLLLHPRGGAKNLPAGARHVLLLNQADAPVSLALARLIVQNLAPPPPLCLIGAMAASTDPVRERWAPMAVAVLAAGQSSRMGRAKQLAIADGDAMVVRAARVALGSSAAQVVVVIGSYAEQVEERLRTALGHAFDRLHLVYNPQWESGQASSVRSALQRFEPSIAAAAIMPVDQPFLTPLLLKQLFYRWRLGAQMVAPSVQNQMRGAPALFDRSIWPELELLEGDVGARTVLRHHQHTVSTVETSAIQLQDIDTPEDLSRYGYLFF